MTTIRRAASAVFLITMIAGRAPAPEKDLHGDELPQGAIARLGTQRFGHSAVIQDLAYSADGKVLISASASITVW